jgi:hypothetical protein
MDSPFIRRMRELLDAYLASEDSNEKAMLRQQMTDTILANETPRVDRRANSRARAVGSE